MLGPVEQFIESMCTSKFSAMHQLVVTDRFMLFHGCCMLHGTGSMDGLHHEGTVSVRIVKLVCGATWASFWWLNISRLYTSQPCFQKQYPSTLYERHIHSIGCGPKTLKDPFFRVGSCFKRRLSCGPSLLAMVHPFVSFDSAEELRPGMMGLILMIEDPLILNKHTLPVP